VNHTKDKMLYGRNTHACDVINTVAYVLTDPCSPIMSLLGQHTIVYKTNVP